jgi:hypothetical protein
MTRLQSVEKVFEEIYYPLPQTYGLCGLIIRFIRRSGGIARVGIVYLHNEPKRGIRAVRRTGAQRGYIYA